MRFVDIATRQPGLISVDAYMRELLEDDPANDHITLAPAEPGKRLYVAIRLCPWESVSSVDWSWAREREVVVHCDDVDRARAVWSAIRKHEPLRLVMTCCRPGFETLMRDTKYPRSGAL